MLSLFLKRWALIFILVVFTYIIGAKTSIAFFHLFFWFLISVLVVNLTFLLTQYFGTSLYLERQLPAKIEAEDTLEIQALVKNNSLLPVFNLVIEDYLSCAERDGRKKPLLIENLGTKSCINLKYSCCYKFSILEFQIKIFF